MTLTVSAIILTLLLFAGLFFIPQLNSRTLPKWMLPTAFILKISVGCFFIFVYSSYYGDGKLTEDAGAFINESKILNEVYSKSPGDYCKLMLGIGDQEALLHKHLSETNHWDHGTQKFYSGNRNLMRIHSLIQFISGSNPYIHAIILCFIGTIGLRILHEAVQKKTTLPIKATFLILLLFPSLLFWSSGLLKESILILGYGLTLKGFFEDEMGLKKLGILLSGLVVIAMFRPHTVGYILIVFFIFQLYLRIPKYRIALSLLITLSLASTVAFLNQRGTDQLLHRISRLQFDFNNVAQGGLHAQIGKCFYYFRPDQLDHLKIEQDSVELLKPIDAIKVRHGSIDHLEPIHLEPNGEKWYLYFTNERSKGYIHMTLINESYPQLFKNIPEAIINSLFRPIPGDPGSLLKFPAIIEVFLVYLFLIFAIIKRRSLSLNDKAVVFGLIIFTLLVSVIIGWITPVLGTITRYRIPAYLAIIIISIILIDVRKIKRFKNE